MPFLATKVRRHSNNCFIRPSKNRRRNLPATVRFSYGIQDEGQEYLAQLQKEAAEARKERGEAVAPPASVVSAEATPSAASEKTFAPGNAKQQWGMMNITAGSQMGLDTLSQELGRFEEVKVTRYNPAIIKDYYFREADITV